MSDSDSSVESRSEPISFANPTTLLAKPKDRYFSKFQFLFHGFITDILYYYEDEWENESEPSDEEELEDYPLNIFSQLRALFDAMDKSILVMIFNFNPKIFKITWYWPDKIPDTGMVFQHITWKEQKHCFPGYIYDTPDGNRLSGSGNLPTIGINKTVKRLKNYEIRCVAVYESLTSEHGQGKRRKAGKIDIHLKTYDDSNDNCNKWEKPLILHLNCSEPCIWHIHASKAVLNNCKLEEINLVSSYHRKCNVVLHDGLQCSDIVIEDGDCGDGDDHGGGNTPAMLATIRHEYGDDALTMIGVYRAFKMDIYVGNNLPYNWPLKKPKRRHWIKFNLLLFGYLGCQHFLQHSCITQQEDRMRRFRGGNRLDMLIQPNFKKHNAVFEFNKSKRDKIQHYFNEFNANETIGLIIYHYNPTLIAKPLVYKYRETPEENIDMQFETLHFDEQKQGYFPGYAYAPETFLVREVHIGFNKSVQSINRLEIRCIGVYEAWNSVHGRDIESKPGFIDIYLKSKETKYNQWNKPLVLHLNSYEPVKWNIHGSKEVVDNCQIEEIYMYNFIYLESPVQLFDGLKCDNIVIGDNGYDTGNACRSGKQAQRMLGNIRNDYGEHALSFLGVSVGYKMDIYVGNELPNDSYSIYKIMTRKEIPKDVTEAKEMEIKSESEKKSNERTENITQNYDNQENVNDNEPSGTEKKCCVLL